MDAGNISAIISALAGTSGVLLGNSFVVIKEWRVNKSKPLKDTAYLAAILVSHLDRFANGLRACRPQAALRVTARAYEISHA